MSEENKENGSDRVKPLEVKPGGKEEGTLVRMKMKKPNKEKDQI